MEFDRHFSRRDLEKLFDDDFRLPDDFLFGVSNAAYQVEGNINGPGEPLNNWAAFERSGKVEESGEAIRFWTDYPEEIELAEKIGLNGFRMGIEWARVQPSTSMSTGTVPPFDQNAMEAYSDILASVMKAGMEPMVTLHHFTHPYWLGLDFWLENDKLGLFIDYVKEVALKINGLLKEKHGLRPVRYWITLNEPNCLAFVTYLASYMPRKKRGLGKALEAWSNMIEAHCRAYDAVHSVYREEGWERPRVTYNTIHISTYGLDKFMTDLLNARHNKVEKSELREYLREGRLAWHREISRCPVVTKSAWINRRIEKRLDDLSWRFLKPERISKGVEALYSSPEPEKLDYLAVDFYDPFLRHLIKPPTLQDIRENRLNLNAELWESVLNPRAMYHFLKAETINGEGKPVIIAENGMCYKVYKGRVDPRSDGATRDKYLQSFIFEAMRALKDGVPLEGYFHWTLVDNYEWGSYEPRFGLHTVDRSRTPVRRSLVDAWGINAAEVYAEIIASLRSGDHQRIQSAFLRDDW